VDAVLDLCENENEKVRTQGHIHSCQIRIMGIKALATTADADHRWVKGNTGVLLQLLGSRKPSLQP
jgi:hypothetical protein